MSPLHFSAPFLPSQTTPRLRALVAASVERILAAAEDPAHHIRRVGTDPIRHIIDWLVVADSQNAHWISRVNAEGVPLKLAKCATIARLRTEADKAMRQETQRAIARLDPAAAGEGEEVEMTFEDGWTIVRLLTAPALDRESDRMGHCVGNGAYDHDVANGRSRIFSLRCPAGRSRVTVELRAPIVLVDAARRTEHTRGEIQIQGPRNTLPPLTHHARLLPLFVRHDAQPAYWLDRALHYAKGRVPEGEPAILTCADTALEYAVGVIAGRWPEAEPLMLRHPRTAYAYAQEVVGGPWPEAETVFAADAGLACQYAKFPLGGRFPAGEAVIAKDDLWAVVYARDVIKARWPEAERQIARHADSACVYARKVIKGRFPEAEEVIRTQAKPAAAYAQHILEGRWPEAEPVIAQKAAVAADYACQVLRGPFPEAEAVIAADMAASARYFAYLAALEPEAPKLEMG